MILICYCIDLKDCLVCIVCIATMYLQLCISSVFFSDLGDGVCDYDLKCYNIVYQSVPCILFVMFYFLILFSS